MKVVLEKKSVDGNVEILSTYFHSNTYAEFTIDEIPDHLEQAHSKINRSFEAFLERGSGWTPKEILFAELKMAKYNPLRVSSYIPTPQDLR